MAWVTVHGIDASLRELADGISTSHRMLIYHFGSKEGLLAEIVATVEAGQRATLDALAAADAPPVVSLRAFWAGLADPAMHPQIRLFFTLVAQALQGRPGTERLRATLVEPWIEVVSAHGVRRGLPVDVARAQARLGMAVTRGLLLDLLATGDRAGVDAAMEAFLAALVTE
jgi:AcrR family transcriptional regulator